MEDQKGLIHWIKEHKEELIIAGIGIGALILIILGIRNQDTLNVLWVSLEKKIVKKPTSIATEAVTKVAANIQPEPVQEVVTVVIPQSNAIPFEVSRHIRNLPDGWHASPEKIADALKNNISLMEGQTWVDSYMKGGTAA